jgi:serralysin
MATPYANAVAITRLSFAGLTTREAGLIDGYKWGGGYGHGVTLTYSFAWVDGPATYSGYSGFGNEWISASELDAPERTAVRQILNDVELVADINLTEVADNADTVGELRFTETGNADYAHAYLPFSSSVRSGDVWFSNRYWNPGGDPVTRGSYEYMTIIHEVGHALGLKHSFERGSSGVRLPAQYDNYLWTVMSYTARAGAGQDVWALFHPTTLMYLDLVALQKMYGKPTDANVGDTEYLYRETRTYWETVSDSSGRDTVIYDSTSRGGLIDLSNQDFSRMGKAVLFSDGTRTFDTIRFGPSTVIENATGGAGDDQLIGNKSRNELIGNDGGDRLDGGSNDDTLQAGRGADTLEGGIGNDTLIGGPGSDRLVGGLGDDTLYLEQSGDRLVDSSGNDTVRSFLASYTLGARLENLTLAGAALDGTGNELDNVIVGNGLANLLKGGAGRDSLSAAGGDDSLYGGSENDTLAGGAGNDWLDGGEGRDRGAGGEGDDLLVWDPADAWADGGIGIDTLEVSGGLDLTLLADTIILDIERIALAAGNLLTLAIADILAISSETDTLTILGDATDTVDIVGDFTVGAEADGFRTYTVDAATLLIDTDITNVV